jgi:enoyl-CoA hydratase/carnithine racemase
MEKYEFQHINIELPESKGGTIHGDYAIISLNRPDKLNAITVQTLEEIVIALNSMELDSKINCVMLRGTKNFTKKPSFSTGADLSSPFKPGIKPNIPIHMTYAMYLFHKSFNIIEQFPKPLIAAIDGFALGGGCELSLVCDIIIASKRSTFGFSEILRGIFPAGGGTQRMVRHIGLARATRMLFFGERFSAEQMYKWGYVHFLVENDNFEGFIIKIMEKMSSFSTKSQYIAKKTLKFGTQAALKIGSQIAELGAGLTISSDEKEE